MAESDERQRDLELRRQLVQRAVDRVWELDLGECVPAGGFRLERGRLRLEAPPPAPNAFLGGEGTAAGLARAYRAGERSPVDVTAQALDRAEATQPSLNAFITILRDSALAEARASEARHRAGQPLGPLDGVPIGVKDLIHMAGVRTTSASRVMADFVADRDAPVIRRLRAGGAVILGKTNLHEFAYGGTGDVSHFGPSRNPRDTERMTGGSSSGSGAAVAGGVCPIALGTDTAGSIRIPAALCGVVGLKATYGLVPTTDVIPLSWSQDHVGPLAASVEDAGLALSALADFELPDLAKGLGRRPRVGVVREHFFSSLDADVRRIVEGALGRLGDVREVQIPHIGFAAAGQSLITGAEAAAFHRTWLDTRADEYNWGVRNRLEAARGIDAVDYVQAIRLRGLLVEEMSAALADVDVLAMPTEPLPAPKLSQREVQLEDGPADAISLLIRNTGPINYTGFPAITVPCGDTPAGLPVGLQLVAPPWQEALLLRVAYAFEQQA